MNQSDLTREELMQAMNANRSLFNQTLANGTDGELFISERVKWSYTGGELSNYVYDIHFKDENEASLQIVEVLSSFSRRGVPTSWILDPFCTPDTLSTVLARYPHSSQGHYVAMAANLTVDTAIETSERITIREANTQEELKVWSGVVCDGFGIDGHERELYQPLIMRSALAQGEQFTFRHFVASLNDQPVSATSLLLDGLTAGLYWVVTVPTARRQRAAATLMSHLFSLAREQGYVWTILQATEMGQALYRHLGFQELYVETYFEGVTL